MKLPLQKTAAAMLVLLLLTAILFIGIATEFSGQSETVLASWELKWASIADVPTTEDSAAISEANWIKVMANGSKQIVPDGINAAWQRFSLPYFTENSAILINKVYGNNIKAFLNHSLIYDSQGQSNYNGSKVLIPLPEEATGGQIYLWSSSGGKEFGIEGGIRVGSYGELLAFYVKQDLMDLVIGATLIFMATVLLVCSLFLKRELLSSGLLLVLVILTFGVMVVTYSPFLPLILSNYGRVIELIFDLALFILLPAFTFYFEKIFGPGKNGIVTRVRKFQMGYSVFCICLAMLNVLVSYQLEDFYKFMSVTVIGFLISLQLIFLLVLAIIYAYSGNTDAVIFSIGFSVFTILSLFELVLYFTSSGGYHFYWWKWGMVVFVVSLIVILGRRFARNHEQLIEYSRDLERFNDNLQRSEKMEIISELAASVAHEVRNPLQVTRGFLQILGERSGKKEKEYLQMAMSELDRASLIITDFLTFAKPGIETVERLEVYDELKHVAGILVPLANLQGGAIELKVEKDLQVLGSSAKFKQAFINIIKNSIESLQQEGLITVTAWKTGEQIIISVHDNGEGMNSSELARLGEPYSSNKTKGTGLGLMVTFRIIEAMDGSIQFQSEKGEGTKVVVKLPVTVRK